MERKRDGVGVVSAGEASGGLEGMGEAIRDDSPQARHSFTVADQVDRLVRASEADPEIGFMARLMALCSLPRTNPGDRIQYKRVNGPYTLYMTAGGGCKLPFGNFPRLLLAWVSTEAVRTQSRELVLGRSLSEFMRSLDVYTTSGGTHTRLRNQMRRLFNAHVQLVYADEQGEARVSSSVADRTEFWVERAQAWRADAVGEQDLSGRGVLQRDHQPPRPARYEHPHGPQAVLSGPRSVPVAGLPHLHASCSAAALLAAGVPSVRPESKQRGHA